MGDAGNWNCGRVEVPFRHQTIDGSRAAERGGPEGRPLWPPPVESCR